LIVDHQDILSSISGANSLRKVFAEI